MTKNDQNKKDSKSVIDVEEYAKSGKPVPKGELYRIRVDSNHYTVEVEEMTGRQILELANKLPILRFQLNQKLHGGVVKKIDYDEITNFTNPGLERFMTIPLDQTEGGK